MHSSQSSARPLVNASVDADERLRPLVQQRFPGGVAVPRGDDRAAVAETKRLLDEGATLLYDAAFVHDGILVVVDVLAERRGKWTAYLQRPNTRIKEKLLADAALHEQVLHGAGFPLGEVVLLLLNPQYIRRGPVDPVALFAEERIQRRLRFVQGLVHGRVQMLRGMAAKKARAAARREAAADAATPVVPPPPPPPPAPRKQVPPPEVIVDKGALRAFLKRLHYPLYFMDFEAYQTPIPEWDGHWSFRQIPFQFSVHCLDAPGGELQHIGYIAPAAVEPTAAFGEALLAATGDAGSVIVYNRDSEGLILEQLKGTHPELTPRVDALLARLVDLMDPFSAGHIRIPDIGNKLSLKFILPSLLPHMNYDALAIGNGVDANRAYLAIRSSTDEAFVNTTREALLEYCRLDTLAMVRILERMEELAADA
ncbi:DUF2779 domain-containing protein [Flaviaesturariibacter flavus]|uniref:DUF2779 domain-containing protein n=1 Tax=Flaviaesturariibacter flavus TaxID=2502780 RepID=A0A4V2NVF6_9BACT|nr:DUF2779 domain-containing protein [Flaviaesturariibacter flavus]TCJ13286.1 DUF2779 domain-containing protein [Flaviaesturariibacter flavus]